MFSRKLFIALPAALMFMLCAQAQAQAPAQHLMSPDEVKTGLRILNQVVGHTGRLIASKNYDTVPREHHEIVEGADILREALAKEPEAFRTEVNVMLDEVIAASNALEPPSKMHDDDKLASAHMMLADKVHEVLDLFPKDVQPMPRN
jgi:hypothetical protein